MINFSHSSLIFHVTGSISYRNMEVTLKVLPDHKSFFVKCIFYACSRLGPIMINSTMQGWDTLQIVNLKMLKIFRSGALSGKMLLLRIVEMIILGQVRLSKC